MESPGFFLISRTQAAAAMRQLRDDRSRTGMRDADGFAPPEVKRRRFRRRLRVAPVLVSAAVSAALAVWLVPQGWAAGRVLMRANDPVEVADRMLDRTFGADAAARGIDDALAVNDADLAKSFVELADARHVPVDDERRRKVDAAAADAASVSTAMKSFAYGFVSGEPTDATSLAGTALGDLFVFGDIRDAVREGGRLAMGEKADTLILGLACVGLAITAGTYATIGAGTPARVGLTLAKAARKTGRLSGELASTVGRMLRNVVDWAALKTALAGVSVTEPSLAVRAARGAVKVERAGRLVDLARDVGKVEAKAGTQAALDALKVAETPREMSRVARLAEKQGGRTRAILKVGGRAAIVLGTAAFDLASWVLGALLTLLGLVASMKRGAERLTESYLRRRKARRRHALALAARSGPV
jgi:hypothetical protein